MTLRRRRLPEELRALAAAFDELVPVLERAKAALTEAVPGTRRPGRPLGEALWAFETDLGEVRDRMDAWRTPEVEAQWAAASDGLAETTARRTCGSDMRSIEPAPSPNVR